MYWNIKTDGNIGNWVLTFSEEKFKIKAINSKI